MTTHLIYHSVESKKQNVSPFDKAIRDLTTDKDISIACPYLGIEYLQNILNLCGSWRLLTDVAAWLEAHKGNTHQISLIQEFIIENIGNIHHYENLHAKAIITSHGILVGSANFTDQGIWKREEVSVIIKDSSQVGELSAWFDRLWENTDCLNNQELNSIDTYIKKYLQNNKSKPENDGNKLKLRAPKIIGNLPEGIKGEQVGNLHLFTIGDITTRIANEEKAKWDSVRRWIYYMINHGKIRAYRFKIIQLLDEEGVNELWQFRSQIQKGGKNRGIHKAKNIIPISEDQLLTIQDVASHTGKSVGKIKKLISNKTIQPKFSERKLFVFDPSVIELIISLPEERSGHKLQSNLDVEVKRLTPLTKIELFVLKTREKENPPFSWEQIAKMAYEEGITKAKSGRRWSQGIYPRAVKKRNLLEQKKHKLSK